MYLSIIYLESLEKIMTYVFPNERINGCQNQVDKLSYTDYLMRLQ